MRGRPKEKTEDEVEWAEGHNRNDNDQRNEKKKGKYFVAVSNEHPTTCFPTACRVRQYQLWVYVPET